MTAIYLIRHGQASFGRSDYDKLSELGHEQARLLGMALRRRVPALDDVVSGDMRRHQETAEGCLRAMSQPRAVRQDAGFNEFDHEQIIARFRPRYQNRLILAAELAASLNPRKAFQEMFREAIARWVSGKYDHDYTESWPAFRARCNAALGRLAASLGASKTAFVFTSAGPISVICQELLQIPDSHAFKLNWTLVNCAVTKVVVGSRGLHLSCLNDHAHFEEGSGKLLTYR